mgnify:CR=1 FL=1
MPERTPPAWLPIVACLLVVVSAGCVAGPVPGAADSPTASASPTPTPTPDSPNTDESTTAAPASATPRSATPATATPTAAPTPLPDRVVELPAGPKALPERPDRPTGETVGAYARVVEYRYAYNALYYNEYTNVTLDCWTESTNRTAVGWTVVVSCRGYSNTRPPTESTATGVHADWFTQTFRYYVDENSTIRGDQVDTR